MTALAAISAVAILLVGILLLRRALGSKRPAATSRATKLPATSANLLLPTGLAQTRSGLVDKLRRAWGQKEISPEVLAQMEEALLSADVGVKTARALLERVRVRLDAKQLGSGDAVLSALADECTQLFTLPMAARKPLSWGHGPVVLLMVGVNGVGKTTTLGKLAGHYVAEGRRVLLVAGDTFRAAAADQLAIWAERSGATLYRGQPSQDPAAVVFDGVKRAVDEKFDLVLIDTAGRLHTQTGLMDELQKIRRVIKKVVADAPQETWIVIDATQGQNAMSQTKLFHDAVGLTGIVLTKLDGTARGGVTLGLAHETSLPIQFIGVGEQKEALVRFEVGSFVAALFSTT